MRVQVPGLPGVYYDTDAESTALTVALTAASRRAPKPHRYALQLLPHLWSFDVDLTEVPDEHPLQFLHPEGARSLDALTRDRAGPNVGRQADLLVRFAWAVNEEVEGAAERFVGDDESMRESLETAAERVVIDVEEADDAGSDIGLEGETDGEFDDRDEPGGSDAFGSRDESGGRSGTGSEDALGDLDDVFGGETDDGPGGDAPGDDSLGDDTDG